MGQAKDRDKKLQAVKDSFSGDAKIVAEAAFKIFDGFILPHKYVGGCYLVTMTLCRFLEDEHGVKTIPVVGYINDGTDDVMISHAWLEFGGKKTDLTLNVVERATGAAPGPVLVHGEIVRAVSVQYSYHMERAPEDLLMIQELINHPQFGPAIKEKEDEHIAMRARVRDRKLMDAYLNGAPAEIMGPMLAALRAK